MEQRETVSRVTMSNTSWISTAAKRKEYFLFQNSHCYVSFIRNTRTGMNIVNSDNFMHQNFRILVKISLTKHLAINFAFLAVAHSLSLHISYYDKKNIC